MDCYSYIHLHVIGDVVVEPVQRLHCCVYVLLSLPASHCCCGFALPAASCSILLVCDVAARQVLRSDSRGELLVPRARLTIVQRCAFSVSVHQE